MNDQSQATDGIKPHSGAALFTVWCKHEKVRRWLPVASNLTRQQAAEEIAMRQDAIRRGDVPAKFTVRPVGERPK